MRIFLGACMRLLLGAKYAPFGCMYAETFGCMYADFGCMYMEAVGCMYAVVGCKVCGCCVQSMRLLGAKHAVVGCKVCGNVWVQSICLLGASLIRLIACLTVGGYTLHVYPLAWAQGPPGAPGPNNQNNQTIKQSNNQSIKQPNNQSSNPSINQ